jgi:50S ribosomal protein L16 3-hydroxylase
VWYRDLGGIQRGIEVAPDEALRLFEAGMTLYFHLEQTHPKMRAWRDTIAVELGVPPNGRISIFAARKSGATSNHFDANHNFTLQLFGAKQWRVAANRFVINPTNNWVPGQSKGDFPARIPRSARRLEMTPGSVLYLPPGYFHETLATTDSVSLNVSFRPPTWADWICNALRARLMEDPRWRASAYGASAQTSPALTEWVEETCQSIPLSLWERVKVRGTSIRCSSVPLAPTSRRAAQGRDYPVLPACHGNR